MQSTVTLIAECYQILFFVVARSAAEMKVVDLQILHGSAELTAPVVSLQDSAMKLAVTFWIEHDSGCFSANRRHEAFRVMSDRNSCFCALGRNR